MEPVELTEEQEIERRIKTADIIARILICLSVILIGGGAAVRLMQDTSLGNSIMFAGLVFVALFGVAAYTKKTLQAKIEAGKTFHNNGR